MKTYVKPELNVKAYAQFENVFTACDKNPSKTNCTYCGPWNPGSGSKPCPVCGKRNSNHASHSSFSGS